MKSFLKSVLDQLTDLGYSLSELTYVVPSRRVATFLNQHIASTLDKPTFEPQIYSVEDFISHIAQVEIVPDLDILFDFYESYTSVEKEEPDSLDDFITWAPTILKDFNEIDRFLVDTSSFFNFLGSIKELEQDHWSILEPKTEMVQKYLHFWNKLELYYQQFTSDCITNGIVYQGLAYRLAFAKAKQKTQNYSQEKPVIFLGLNALNKAEEEIIKIFLEENIAHVFWDADAYFMEQKHHEAGKFLRGYQENWKVYDQKEFALISEGFSSAKKIEIIGSSGNIGMAQAAGNVLKDLIKQGIAFDKTAVVLADEALLIPLLSAIPEEIKHLNITMGLTLDKTPLASFFMQLLTLKTSVSEQGYYFKNVNAVLESAFSHIIASEESYSLLQQIHKENLVYIAVNTSKSHSSISYIDLLIEQVNNGEDIMRFLSSIIELLKDKLSSLENRDLELEQLQGIFNILEQLKEIQNKQKSSLDPRSIIFLFRQLLPQKKLDFIGEPVKGLQIMGLLETRALDYENIIMLSVNEGVLPAGKSTASYIPYDMKIKYGLPTYSDKDSVYAYHFYRLLQRCHNPYFIYNSESSTLGGGEKSRFLLQLVHHQLENHDVKERLFANPVTIENLELLSIIKDESYFTRLNEIAHSGFSPSSITSYIYNPLDFYRSKILKVQELEEVEEDIAANTMGTMIHKALEQLYRPFLNQKLQQEDFKLIKAQVQKVMEQSYFDSYKTTKLPSGKNTIIFEVATHYVKKMIDHDLQTVTNGQELIIKNLEIKFDTTINIEKIGTVKLHGEVDRIDQLDGVVRIIDYKSGSVTKSNVGLEPDDYEELITDYHKSKAFQVLMYAYLYSKNNTFTECTAGIISFKNFKEGFIPYATKKGRSYVPKLIDEAELLLFEDQLQAIIKELYDPAIRLTEKEV